MSNCSVRRLKALSTTTEANDGIKFMANSDDGSKSLEPWPRHSVFCCCLSLFSARITNAINLLEMKHSPLHSTLPTSLSSDKSFIVRWCIERHQVWILFCKRALIDLDAVLARSAHGRVISHSSMSEERRIEEKNWRYSQRRAQKHMYRKARKINCLARHYQPSWEVCRWQQWISTGNTHKLSEAAEGGEDW